MILLRTGIIKPITEPIFRAKPNLLGFSPLCVKYFGIMLKTASPKGVKTRKIKGQNRNAKIPLVKIIIGIIIIAIFRPSLLTINGKMM